MGLPIPFPFVVPFPPLSVNVLSSLISFLLFALPLSCVFLSARTPPTRSLARRGQIYSARRGVSESVRRRAPDTQADRLFLLVCCQIASAVCVTYLYGVQVNFVNIRRISSCCFKCPQCRRSSVVVVGAVVHHPCCVGRGERAGESGSSTPSPASLQSAIFTADRTLIMHGESHMCYGNLRHACLYQVNGTCVSAK